MGDEGLCSLDVRLIEEEVAWIGEHSRQQEKQLQRKTPC
jgi:hypothetical protein